MPTGDGPDPNIVHAGLSMNQEFQVGTERLPRYHLSAFMEC
jgi:hypothetical protein